MNLMQPPRPAGTPPTEGNKIELLHQQFPSVGGVDAEGRRGGWVKGGWVEL